MGTFRYKFFLCVYRPIIRFAHYGLTGRRNFNWSCAVQWGRTHYKLKAFVYRPNIRSAHYGLRIKISTATSNGDVSLQIFSLCISSYHSLRSLRANGLIPRFFWIRASGWLKISSHLIAKRGFDLFPNFQPVLIASSRAGTSVGFLIKK